MRDNNIHEQLEAEIKCLHCKQLKWVPWDLRQAGHQVPPKGVDVHQTARCRPCPSTQDFTVWTGRKRWKAEVAI